MIGDIAGGILLALFILFIGLPLALYLLFAGIGLVVEVVGNMLCGLLDAYDSFMRGAGRVCGFFVRH
jgi:hypothetical protein